MPKRFLCVGEPYEKNGVKKISWKRIGEIFTAKTGKEYVKIYHMPGTIISLFTEEKKDAPVKQSEYGPLAPDENLPF